MKQRLNKNWASINFQEHILLESHIVWIWRDVYTRRTKKTGLGTMQPQIQVSNWDWEWVALLGRLLPELASCKMILQQWFSTISTLRIWWWVADCWPLILKCLRIQELDHMWRSLLTMRMLSFELFRRLLWRSLHLVFLQGIEGWLGGAVMSWTELKFKCLNMDLWDLNIAINSTVVIGK